MARGDLSRSPGRGKKIDTLHYDVVQDGKDGAIEKGKIVIDVYLQKKFQDGSPPPKAVTSTMFTVRCEAAKEEVHGTDLDTILKGLRAKLDVRYKIKWENWLKVRVTPARIFDATGAGLELSWTRVERGVTIDGDVLMRTYNHHADWSNRWTIEPWPEVFKDRSGKAVACIPATEANEQSLTAFSGKIDEMRKALAEFVAPDHIEETLRAIADGSMRMLTRE